MKRRNFFAFLLGGLVAPIATLTPTLLANKKYATLKAQEGDLDNGSPDECRLVTYIIPNDSPWPTEDFESYYQWEPRSITKSHHTYILKRKIINENQSWR